MVAFLYISGLSSELIRMVDSDPSTLVYKDGNNPMLVMANRGIQIPMALPNKLYNESRPLVIPLDITNFQQLTSLLSTNAIGHNYLTMHTSFTFNAPHIFAYTTAEQLHFHVLRSIVKDNEQYRKMTNAGIFKTDRLIERLLILKGTDEARQMTAIASLYPMELLSSSRVSVNDILLLYRTWKNDLKYGSIMRDILNLKYTIGVTPIHQLCFLRYGMPFVQSFIDIEPFDRDNMAFASTGYSAVSHDLGFDGEISTVKLNPLMVSGNGVTIELTYKNVGDWNAMVNSMTILPSDEEEFTPDDVVSKTIAETIFMLGGHNGVSSYNNLDNSHTMTAFKNIYQRQFINLMLDKNYRVAAGSLDHLIACLCIKDGLSYSSNNQRIVLNQTYVINNNFNNSTLKLLIAYSMCINKRRATQRTEGDDDVDFTLFMRPGETLIVLGGITEPVIPILQRFNGLVKNIRITSRGLEAYVPNTRANALDIIEKNISATFIISDIDQTSFNDFTEMVDFSKRLALKITSTSLTSIMKVNYPSRYLINSIVHEAGSKFLGTKSSLSFELVKMAAQNQYSNETFVLMNISEEDMITDTIEYFDSQTIQIAKYETNLPTPWSMASTLNNRILPTIPDPSLSDAMVFNTTVMINDLPSALSLAQQVTSKVNYFRVSRTSSFMDIYGHTEILRQRLINRRHDKQTYLYNMQEYSRYIPYGLGLDSQKQYGLYRYIDGFLMNRMAIYKRVYKHLDNIKILPFPYNETVIIGSRDYLDYTCLPTIMDSKPLTMIDPVLEHSNLVHPFLHITILNEEFDFINNTFIIPQNSIVLCLNVIMTDVSRRPVDANTQIARIVSLAKRVNNANSRLYISYFKLDMIERITPYSPHILIDETTIKIRDYAPAFGLDTLNLLTKLAEEDVQAEVLKYDERDVIDVCTHNLVALSNEWSSDFSIISAVTEVLCIT